MSVIKLTAASWFIFFAGCAAQTTVPSASGDPSAEQSSQVLLHTVPVGDLEIRFYGESVPAGISPRYGVQRMAVLTPQGELEFTPQGELFHSDWSFEIVSPDGNNILLLQDHYGPYHVVSVSNLSSYLSTGQPDFEFGQSQPDSNAWVHEQARWLNDLEIAYVAGLTTVSEYRFSLTSGD